MKVRTRWAIRALLAGALAVGGCWDSEGRITAGSIQAFWAQVDRDFRAGLERLAARPAHREPSLWGPMGRPKPSGSSRGTLLARRHGRTVEVEVYLTNVPQEVQTMATGLKLRNGEAVEPKSVLLLDSPPVRDEAAPNVQFAFDEAAPGGAGGGPTVCLRVTYELGRTISADRATFTLVLGEPEGPVACTMGITSAVSVRDGGPTLTGCVRLAAADDFGGPPLPPPPPARTPTVSFRFRELPARGPDASLVWIAPAVESIYPEGPPTHATITARAAAPEPHE